MNRADTNPTAPEESPRLLFVVNDAAFFLSHRLPIAEAARDAGWEVSVAAPEVRVAREILAKGLGFHPLQLSRRGALPWEEARSLASLVGLFRRERPDIVHLVTIKPVLYGGVAARLAGIRGVVSAVSGLGTVFLSQGVSAVIRRKAVEAAYHLAFSHPSQRVILQNPDDLEMFVRKGILDPARAVLIRGSGVSLDEFPVTQEPDGTPLVVLAARMLKDKGVLEFVEAAKLLRRDGVDARFALVGPVDPGNASAVSEARLRAFVRDGAVEWWGARADMPQVLAGCHVVCLPSYGEGVPKVLLEAAACGRAIVTTDVPGCREVVAHEHNGLIVPPRNARELGAAIRRLLESPEERRAMGRAGRARAVREFSVGSVVNATLKIYGEVLSKA
jgi:glycosyltransferase involved in cell wall biosynthesis